MIKTLERFGGSVLMEFDLLHSNKSNKKIPRCKQRLLDATHVSCSGLNGYNQCYQSQLDSSVVVKHFNYRPHIEPHTSTVVSPAKID